NVDRPPLASRPVAVKRAMLDLQAARRRTIADRSASRRGEVLREDGVVNLERVRSDVDRAAVPQRPGAVLHPIGVERTADDLRDTARAGDGAAGRGGAGRLVVAK